MGIFDFIKGNKKSKSEKSEKRSIDVSQTSNDNSKKEILAHKIADVLDESKEIILTEEEIQKYIHQEISKRISIELKFEFSSSNFDSLFQESEKIVVEHQQVSASLLQRKLKLGYYRAGKLIDELELAGIVGPYDGQRARTVSIPNIHQLELFFQIKNQRFNHFKKHILPLHEERISTALKEINKAQEIVKENELKEILKQEILDKKKELIEE